MASKKINPKIAPKPPVIGSNDDDEITIDDILGGGGAPATTTTIPGQFVAPTRPTYVPSSTTVPSTQKPSTVRETLFPGKGDSEWVDEITKEIEGELRKKYTAEEIAQYASGQKKPKEKSVLGKIWGGVTGTLDTVYKAPVTWGLKYTLKTLDVIDNTVMAAIDYNRQYSTTSQLSGYKPKEDTYTKKEDIPVHKDTGVPIAKVGDPIIREANRIVGVDLGLPDNATQQQKEQAVADYTSKFLEERDTPLKKFWADVNDPKFGFGSLAGNQTGNKWIDRIIGFTGDVALAPSTYLGMPGGNVSREAVAVLGDDGVKLIDDLATSIIDDLDNVVAASAKGEVKISRGVAARLVTNATRKAEPIVAKILGPDVAKSLAEKGITGRQAQQLTAAVINEAVALAKTQIDDLATSGVGAYSVLAPQFDSVVNTAAKRWGAVAPRRVLGAANREALALNILKVRDDAARVVAERAGTAQARRAQNVIDILTDEVIGNIATKGYSAFDDLITVPGAVKKITVGEALGLPSGLRLGGLTVPLTKSRTAKIPTEIPLLGGKELQFGLQPLTSKTAYGLRKYVGKAAQSTTKIPGVRRGLLELLTPLGRGGVFPGTTVYDARLGLRTQSLTGKRAVDAIKILAENEVYRDFKKAGYTVAKNNLRKVFSGITNRKLYKTVYRILEIPIDELRTLLQNKNVASILSAKFKSTVTEEEVQLARQVLGYLESLYDATKTAIGQLPGADEAVLRAEQEAFSNGIVPQILTDRGATFLGARHTAKAVYQGFTRDKLISDTLKSLGYEQRLLPTQFKMNEVKVGTWWFGEKLTAADIAGGIGQLNRLAKERLQITFDIFDTDIQNILERYTEKWANDYAFLKLIGRENIEGPLRSIWSQQIIYDRAIIDSLYAQFADNTLLNLSGNIPWEDYTKLGRGLGLDVDEVAGIKSTVLREILETARDNVSGTPQSGNAGLDIISIATKFIADPSYSPLDDPIFVRLMEVAGMPANPFQRGWNEQLDNLINTFLQEAKVETGFRQWTAAGAEKAVQTLKGLIDGLQDEIDSLPNDLKATASEALEARKKDLENLQSVINVAYGKISVAPLKEQLFSIIQQRFPNIDIENIKSFDELIRLHKEEVGAAQLQLLDEMGQLDSIFNIDDYNIALVQINDVVEEINLILDFVVQLFKAGSEPGEVYGLGIDAIRNLLTENPYNAVRQIIFGKFADLPRSEKLKMLEIFALPEQRALEYVDDLANNPDVLQSIIPFLQDAFVSLDNQIVPTAIARKQIADMFSNMTQFTNARFRSNFARIARDYNKFIKTWVTTTVGFHTRNTLGNLFQYVAAGGKLENFREGIRVASRWNSYLKKLAKEGIQIDDAGYIMDESMTFDDIINGFMKYAEIPESRRAAVKQSLESTGSSGTGDIGEAFGTALPERTGILGQTIRSRPETPLGQALETTSSVGGYLPRKSRKFGGYIEDLNRFTLMYDGMRQGLPANQAAARVRRFLFDYEDLSTLDEAMKTVVPFWLWMSRNLPLQLQEMFYNPKIYQQYNNFRKNFEDEDGNSILMPSYLKDAGVFKSGGIFFKPEIGIPGTGTPTPLQEIANLSDIESVLAGVPAYNLLRTIEGEQLFTGRELTTPEEKVTAIARQAIPILPTIGRTISGIPGIGAGSDWGPGLTGLQELLGVRGPSTAGASPESMQRRALLSYLGLPFTTVGPNEERAAKYEELERLKALARSQGIDLRQFGIND